MNYRLRGDRVAPHQYAEFFQQQLSLSVFIGIFSYIAHSLYDEVGTSLFLLGHKNQRKFFCDNFID